MDGLGLGLGQKTNLMFSKRMGTVLKRDHYLVIQNEDNPHYHWGNYLLFEKAPQKGDFKNWVSLFKREFPYYQNPSHLLFSWVEQDKGEFEEFIAQNFELDEAKILSASELVKPKKCSEEILIRKISSQSDWNKVIKLQVKCADPKFMNEDYKKFKDIQMGQYRSMSEAGMGYWFGAFVGDELVGDLGIFFDKGIGRYQSVETHPDYRNKGICSNLVYETGLMAMNFFDLKTLVMEADAHYHAAKIYEKLGFAPTEVNYALSWWIK